MVAGGSVLAAHLRREGGERPRDEAAPRGLSRKGGHGHDLPHRDVARPRGEHAAGPLKRPQDQHPVAGAWMVQMAAERPPHSDHALRGAVGPGEVLVAGEQPAEQERARRTRLGIGRHRQMRTADPAKLAVVELQASHLRADESEDAAFVIDRHERRELRVGPRGVD